MEIVFQAERKHVTPSSTNFKWKSNTFTVRKAGYPDTILNEAETRTVLLLELYTSTRIYEQLLYD